MSASPITDLPPLENGDRLTRQEFERRYTAMTHIKRDMARVLAVLQQGLQTAEHQAFVERSNPQ